MDKHEVCDEPTVVSENSEGAGMSAVVENAENMQLSTVASNPSTAESLGGEVSVTAASRRRRNIRQIRCVRIRRIRPIDIPENVRQWYNTFRAQKRNNERETHTARTDTGETTSSQNTNDDVKNVRYEDGEVTSNPPNSDGDSKKD